MVASLLISVKNSEEVTSWRQIAWGRSGNWVSTVTLYSETNHKVSITVCIRRNTKRDWFDFYLCVFGALQYDTCVHTHTYSMEFKLANILPTDNHGGWRVPCIPTYSDSADVSCVCMLSSAEAESVSHLGWHNRTNMLLFACRAMAHPEESLELVSGFFEVMLHLIFPPKQ